jgi:hypothetical protein
MRSGGAQTERPFADLARRGRPAKTEVDARRAAGPGEEARLGDGIAPG